MIRIVNDTGVATSTKVLDEVGVNLAEALSIEKLSITINGADPVVRATLHLGLVQTEISPGKAAWLVMNPATRKWEAVDRIVFSGGDVVDFRGGAPKIEQKVTAVTAVGKENTTKFRPPPAA